jgi:hypothetical protein
MKKYVPLLSFMTLVAVLVWAGTQVAVSATGDPVLLGRQNWTGGTTKINYDNSVEGPAAPSAGLVAEGYPAGVVGVTNPDYMPSEIYQGYGAGVVGGGNDIGGLFYGVDQGIVARGDYTGAILQGSETALEATGGRVGVHAEGETALEAKGQVTFSTAGFATIAQGATSVTIKLGFDVSSATKILATAQSSGGTVQRVGRNFATDAFTIYLTQGATQKVTIAYFVIS